MLVVLLRDDGFYCSLDVLYGDLGIAKLQLLIKKIKNLKFSNVNVFQFLVIKKLDPDWIRIGIKPKMLDPDSKHCLYSEQILMDPGC